MGHTTICRLCLAEAEKAGVKYPSGTRKAYRGLIGTRPLGGSGELSLRQSLLASGVLVSLPRRRVKLPSLRVAEDSENVCAHATARGVCCVTGLALAFSEPQAVQEEGPNK